jgi:hypothetical protein
VAQAHSPGAVEAGMPEVIPVQAPPPTYANSNNTVPVAVNIIPQETNDKIAAMESESTRMVSQLQTEYTQKLNDFSIQNKALQDQVQLLNTRMGTIETQMGQLVHALTRQQRAVPMASPEGMNNIPPPPPPNMPAEPRYDVRTSYSVQAIIPGRAWLKSDSGETVTVAEGDSVRGLGRVTRIDPYDGVVEISTGRKVIALSYGNGV